MKTQEEVRKALTLTEEALERYQQLPEPNVAVLARLDGEIAAYQNVLRDPEPLLPLSDLIDEWEAGQ